MSFSAATCLTFNPTIQHSDGPFDIYLNSDYSSTPFSSVTLSDISINCPFIFKNIPDTTTNFGIKDTIKNYCITIQINNNDVCNNCLLGLSEYSSTTISVITAGILTGSCQSIISDYKINWYGPNNTTNLAFSSGGGSTFSYDYQHPLIGDGRSIPQNEGVYTPIIENVIINNISYSNTGGTDNILFQGNCLPTTNVLPLTCNLGTNNNKFSPYSAYTHFLSLNVPSSKPKQVSSTFKLSAGTKYLAWAFKAYGKSDRLTISFSGSNYGGTIIGLEDIIVGSNEITNLTPSLYPKRASIGVDRFLPKITTLTGLTINDNDIIKIDIDSPEPDTLWDFYITCVNDWDCNDCITDQQYKISGSTIKNVTGDCGYTSISFKITNCNFEDNKNSDLLTYVGFYPEQNDGLTNFEANLQSEELRSLLYTPHTTCSSDNCGYKKSVCVTGVTKTIYDKTFLTDGKGVYGFTGSSDFISSYYNSWVNVTNGSCSGSTNVNSIDYYRYVQMTIPSDVRPDSCGDVPTGVLPSITLFLHMTSTVLTGTTGSQYYMKLTANTITNHLTFNVCDSGCLSSVQRNVVERVNNCSTGITTNNGTNRTFNSGVYFSDPLFVNKTYSGVTSQTATTYDGVFRTTSYNTNTYPFSGNPSTIIPSLSGTVCNYNSTGDITNNATYKTYNHYKFKYKIILTNTLDSKDFDIFATPIVNYSLSGSSVLAYRYSGGSVYTNPTYII